MQLELQSQNLRLSQGSIQKIEQLVGHGIQRMKASNAIDNAGFAMRAETNMKSLIKYLGDYAREEGTFPDLNDSMFDAAMLACPTYWPYSSSG